MDSERPEWSSWVRPDLMAQFLGVGRNFGSGTGTPRSSDTAGGGGGRGLVGSGGPSSHWGVFCEAAVWRSVAGGAQCWRGVGQGRGALCAGTGAGGLGVPVSSARSREGGPVPWASLPRRTTASAACTPPGLQRPLHCAPPAPGLPPACEAPGPGGGRALSAA